MQPWQEPDIIWPVGRLVRYLQAMLHSDEILQDIWVRGEVSNLSRPESGHLFFTLKDRWGQIRCVMWSEYVEALDALPRNGQEVEVHGRVDFYPARSMLQLYVDALRPVGEGALFQELMRRKARLEAEGLFDRQRKRPLPPFPRVIAVVTSATSAALRDILRTLQRRYPLAEVWIVPSLVQGEEAPARLTLALDVAARARPDLIILARGGGSLEDLMPFNHEDVVRAVAASPVPVVTGVGHETDFTLVDFAADRRAATPTAAAETATPDRQDLIRRLQALHGRMLQAYFRHMERLDMRLERLGWRLHRVSPVYALARERQHLDELHQALHRGLARQLERRALRLQALGHRLEAAHPLAPLRRGYAWVTDMQGRTVTRPDQVPPGTRVRIHLREGTLQARVEAHAPPPPGSTKKETPRR